MVSDFAKNDIPTVANLEANEFSHITDIRLRRTIAETFYGARWIYKVGLALLVKDVEQIAHVRTQVMDYGAVCEGLLSDTLLHAIQTNRMAGQKYLVTTPPNARQINWNVQDKLSQLTKQSFFWHIDVALEEGIIDVTLKDDLHRMRKERNTVHIRARTYNAYLSTSKSLFKTVTDTIDKTKRWKAANP